MLDSESETFPPAMIRTYAAMFIAHGRRTFGPYYCYADDKLPEESIAYEEPLVQPVVYASLW